MRKLVIGGDVKTVFVYVDKWKDSIKAVNTAGVAANSDELMRRWRFGSISQQQTTRPAYNVPCMLQRDRATDALWHSTSCQPVHKYYTNRVTVLDSDVVTTSH